MHESENQSEVAQSCPTLCDPMDCRLPGSSVHGIFQARVLEWGAIAFSEISEWPSPKKSTDNNAGEGVEKREPSCTVCGNVNWYGHYGRQYGDSSKKKLFLKNKTTTWSSNPTARCIPWGNKNWKRHMHPNVHCGLFTIVRTRKQPRCPSTYEWIKKLWYIYTQWSISHKKEHFWISSNGVVEPRAYYTEWSKSERERQNIVY